MDVKLNEKIVYCRKRAGLSQEALAEKIGVSRQAVSKWETGDAEPELNKIRLLCEAFGVSADWLLSEEEPQEEYTYNKEPTTEPKQDKRPENIPGVAGRLVRRFGWLAGVYVSLVGAGALIFGLLVRFVITAPMRDLMNDPMWNMTGELDNIMKSNPIFAFGNVIIVSGVFVIIAGIILAVFLKKRLNK